MLPKLIKAFGISRRVSIFLMTLALLWVGVIVSSGLGWNPFQASWNFSNPGAFGDSFGPLNTMMAAIAAIGAIAAYRGQAREAARAKAREEDQDEIAMSDRERFIRRDIEADKRLEKSTFETTFFKLLDAFRSIVSSVDIKTAQGTVVSAHDAFQSTLNRMNYINSMSDGPKEAWIDLSERYVNDLNHYFRFLYHIVLYVHCSRTHDKYFYVRLLRAMLSEAELVLLALNCEYGEGRKKFKGLVEEYSLLHNISEEARGTWGLYDLYSETAFARSNSSAAEGKSLD
jgi:Putative phage abortive infection protein